jgi:hypothetical protein
VSDESPDFLKDGSYPVKRWIAARTDSGVVGAGLRFAREHPRTAAWIVLSAGIDLALLIGGRDAGLPLATGLILLGFGIAVAGLCVWIVAGGKEDESAGRAQP